MLIVLRQAWPGYSYGINKGGSLVRRFDTAKVKSLLDIPIPSPTSLVRALGFDFDGESCQSTQLYNPELVRRVIDALESIATDGGGPVGRANWREGKWGEFTVFPQA